MPDFLATHRFRRAKIPDGVEAKNASKMSRVGYSFNGCFVPGASKVAEIAGGIAVRLHAASDVQIVAELFEEVYQIKLTNGDDWRDVTDKVAIRQAQDWNTTMRTVLVRKEK
ncbi:hypothetical protein PP940_gp126 [Rhizobium phage RL2RES]|uniref:Uncharacterized protein n=1 Tax=Rhizobium phage RL2RES TaxID=103371 RepID=A0A6B9J398_9CAUD|nr:hypothetical protein PP940_gp126 [Rhizobium phage RL2RES]QGZ14243.1 hypothetical protein RL2RES_126 [Rhizobium phage RL2RES]